MGKLHKYHKIILCWPKGNTQQNCLRNFCKTLLSFNTMFLDHIEMCKEPYMVYGPHIMTTQRHTRDSGYEQGEVSLIHGNTRGSLSLSLSLCYQLYMND